MRSVPANLAAGRLGVTAVVMTRDDIVGKTLGNTGVDVRSNRTSER
jgi:hypothetical protein